MGHGGDDENGEEVKNPHSQQRPQAATALVLGIFASGVNAPTWVVVKVVMVALGISLMVLLQVALQFSSIKLVGHVLILMLLAGVLFTLLCWFISQIGLAAVEQQLEDLYSSSEEDAHLRLQKDVKID
eukprot:c20414_g1_i1 orf=71-454(+)